MRRSILLLSFFAAAPLSAQAYSITHTYTLGGEGGWDYVVTDAPNHRLFVGRSNRVMVIDMNDGHLIAEVTGIKGAHGTALVPDIGRGFATSGNDSSVMMFDSKTYKTLLKIPAAEDADATEWAELKQVYRDYQRATLKTLEVRDNPARASLSDEPLRFHKRGSGT